MAGAADIKITGAKELRSQLRKANAQKSMYRAHKKVAERVVVPEAKRRAGASFPNLAGGMSRAGSQGVGSIRANATQTKAFVVMGKKNVPWMGGMNFGSSGRYRQFPAKAEPDRFLFVTIADKHDEIIEAYYDSLEEEIEGAFPQGGW